MSICKINNAEVGELELYDLSIAPVFGMIGTGEPTERGSKRMLEKLQQGKGEKGNTKHFLQIEKIINPPIPLLRVDAFLTAAWKPNEASDLSCLSVVWLIDELEEVLSSEIKSLFNELKWTEFAEEFIFN